MAHLMGTEKDEEESGPEGEFLASIKVQIDKLLQWERDSAELLEQFGIKTNIIQYSKEFKQVFIKVTKKKIDVVVIGKTSSGKSLMINNLLGIDVMRSGIGDTTPSAVRIQATSLPMSYYQYVNDEERYEIDFNDKEDLEDFHHIVDRSSSGEFQNDQNLEVFISKRLMKKNSIISENVSILDTPGMERDAFKSDEVKERVREADAIVLVVDINSSTDNDKIREVLNDQSFFVKPNVLVAVNKCDELLAEKPYRRENTKNNVIKELSKLPILNNRSNAEMNNKIFFVSAKLNSKLKSSNNQDEITDGERKLEDAFHKFERAVFSIAQKNSEKKKHRRIKDASARFHRGLETVLSRITSQVQMVKSQIHQLITDIEKATREVEESEDFNFIKTVPMEDLWNLKSGRERVLAFLEHCKIYGFDGIKDNIIRVPVEVNLLKIIENILRMEIDQICLDDDRFKPFVQLLDIIIFDSSLYDEKQHEIDAAINNVRQAFAEECRIKNQEQLNEFVKGKTEAIEARQQKIDELINEIERYMKMANVGKYVNMRLCSPSEIAPGNEATAGAITIALLCIGPPGWIATGICTAVAGYGESMVKSKSEEKAKLEKDCIRDKREIILRDNLKEEKIKYYKSTQEERVQILELELMAEINERNKMKEQQRVMEQYKTFHRKALTDFYISIIKCVSEALQMRLKLMIDYLDVIQNNDSKNNGNKENAEKSGSDTNTMQAGSDTDTIQAGSDTNKMQAGSDTITIQAGSDTNRIQAGSDTNTMQAGSDTNTIQAGSDTNKIQAGFDTNKIQAGSDTNRIQGESDTNTIHKVEQWFSNQAGKFSSLFKKN